MKKLLELTHYLLYGNVPYTDAIYVFGCDGVLGGKNVFDACGVCGGDGTTCVDCAGVPNGKKQMDVCGICGGEGNSCNYFCDTEPDSGNITDLCGICGGENTIMPPKGKVKIRSRDGGYLIGVIADEDTITGLLLSGVGNVDNKKQKNFFVVTSKTTQSEIENSFRTFTSREDIAIILISQKIADEIRYLLNEYDKLIPTILEIPSKDHPYDPTKDSVMARILRMQK